MVIFYDILLALSIGLTILYAFIWHRHFDVHLTLIFAFIPIAMLGYSMATRADDRRHLKMKKMMLLSVN